MTASVYPSTLRSTCLRTPLPPLSVLRLFFPSPLLSTSFKWPYTILAKLICQMRISGLTIYLFLNFLFKYLCQYFCNGNMYFTQEMVPNIAGFDGGDQEGGSWMGGQPNSPWSEALLIFTTFLNPLLYYIYIEENHKVQAIKKNILGRWKLLPYQVTFYFLVPYRTSHPGSCVLRSYRNYKCEGRTLCPTR